MLPYLKVRATTCHFHSPRIQVCTSESRYATADGPILIRLGNFPSCSMRQRVELDNVVIAQHSGSRIIRSSSGMYWRSSFFTTDNIAISGAPFLDHFNCVFFTHQPVKVINPSVQRFLFSGNILNLRL